MPTTIKTIWNDLDIHSKQALQYADDKLALGSKEIETKYYSEKEVDIIIQRCISTKIDIEHFQKTGLISCSVCHNDFIKIDEYSWKPSCNCFKEDIVLSRG